MTESQTTTIPVVPLSILSPQTFLQLSAYLYTHSANDLLAFLLSPCTLAAHTPPSVDETDMLTLQQHARRMTETYNLQVLLAQAMTINGFWQNACALGIFDLGLWDCTDVPWEVVLTALAITTGRRHRRGKTDGTRTAARAMDREKMMAREGAITPSRPPLSTDGNAGAVVEPMAHTCTFVVDPVDDGGPGTGLGQDGTGIMLVVLVSYWRHSGGMAPGRHTAARDELHARLSH